MIQRRTTVKEAPPPSPADGGPQIACLELERLNHLRQISLLLAPSQRLSTVEGLEELQTDVQRRGLPLPDQDPAELAVEVERHASRARMFERVIELRKQYAHDALSFIVCADEAHCELGNIDGSPEEPEDPAAYVSRYAIAADGWGGPGIECIRVAMAATHSVFHVLGAVEMPRASGSTWAPLLVLALSIGRPRATPASAETWAAENGVPAEGKSNLTSGRDMLADARTTALRIAAEPGITPAQRYARLAAAAAAEVPEICGAMLSVEFAHAALFAHAIGATEDVWPDTFHGAHRDPELRDAKLEAGRVIMKVCRQVLDDEERARHAEDIRRESEFYAARGRAMAAGEVHHG